MQQKFKLGKWKFMNSSESFVLKSDHFRHINGYAQINSAHSTTVQFLVRV